MADTVLLQQLGIALQDVAVTLEDLDRLRMAALRAQRRPHELPRPSEVERELGSAGFEIGAHRCLGHARRLAVAPLFGEDVREHGEPLPDIDGIATDPLQRHAQRVPDVELGLGEPPLLEQRDCQRPLEHAVVALYALAVAIRRVLPQMRLERHHRLAQRSLGLDQTPLDEKDLRPRTLDHGRPL